MQNNSRIIQFDVLRIIAAIAVILIHISTQIFDECYPSSEWEARNLYNSLARWAVPIFVMISGSLFLDSQRDISIKNLFAKNIKRIILIFFFWSFIYSVYDGFGKGLIILFGKIIYGPFHFWFLKLIIGLYVSVPILRAIVTNKKLEEYFICLSLVTAFLVPMLFPLIGYISDVARDFAEKSYDEFGIKIALGHVGYFVMGHYISTYNIENKLVRSLMYILGILSVIFVVALTQLSSSIIGAPCVLLYDNINMFTLFETLSIFIVVKNMRILPQYHNYIINTSKLSLGIYIIHPLVMNLLNDMCGIDSAYLNPIYFIPILTLLVFIISLVASLLLIRIPGLKKFMS